MSPLGRRPSPSLWGQRAGRRSRAPGRWTASLDIDCTSRTTLWRSPSKPTEFLEDREFVRDSPILNGRGDHRRWPSVEWWPEDLPPGWPCPGQHHTVLAPTTASPQSGYIDRPRSVEGGTGASCQRNWQWSASCPRFEPTSIGREGDSKPRSSPPRLCKPSAA